MRAKDNARAPVYTRLEVAAARRDLTPATRRLGIALFAVIALVMIVAPAVLALQGIAWPLWLYVPAVGLASLGVRWFAVRARKDSTQ
jgi:hypothetical protein